MVLELGQRLAYFLIDGNELFLVVYNDIFREVFVKGN